ncbi:MAG: ATP-binding protein [Ardenticatenaceae bacterium]
MSLNSSRPSQSLDRLLPRIRIPIFLITLGLILYYAIYLVFNVPYYGFTFIWRPDNVATVYGFEPYENPPAAQMLQPGDILIAIDGEPVRHVDGQPLFPALKSSYEYTIQRDGRLLTFDIPVASAGAAAVVERITAGTVALIIWAVAGLIILFARPQNRDAWRVGIVFLGIAVSLAASEASLQGVPLARLGSEPLLPVLVVGFLSLALLPRSSPPARRERTAFAALYAIAIVFGLAFLWEILYLSPRGRSLESLTGVSLYHHLLFSFLGIGGLGYVAILIIRSLGISQTHLRQQARILLAFTALAIVPGVLLTLIPVAISDSFVLSWIFFIALLSLIPAGYGYLIYRRKYLGLDLFISRSLTLLLMSLALLVVYGTILYFLQNRTSLQAMGPLSSYLALVIGLVVVPFTGKPSRQAIHSLIYGPQVPYEETLARFTAMLAADPQISTLRRVLAELMEVLQVREAALFLASDEHRLVCVERVRVEAPRPISLDGLNRVPSEPMRRSRPEAGMPSHLLDSYPWAELALFLSVGDARVGLLLLGAPVPGGYFNAQQVSYIRQAGSMMAVAIEAIRLFETSREMSRELMVVRETERAQLAAQIHDDPIQRISVVMNGLASLEAQPNLSVSEASDSLHAYRETLRGAASLLRDICAGLYSPVLGQGIQVAIRDMARDFARQANVNVELAVGVPDELVIPYRITTTVYHVLTEALNNIQKHAEATRAWMELNCQNGHLQLVVADNGRGNGLASASVSALIRARQFGIAGMYEWANLAQGELHISKRPEGGTVITLQVPLDGTSDGSWQAG